MNSNRVIVGIDGSVAGDQALRWAAAEAVRRRANLTVLSAYSVPVSPSEEGYGLGMEAMRERAQDVVGAAARQLSELRECRVPAVPDAEHVEWEVVAGTPAGILVSRTGPDRLVVVGQRGLGGFDRVVLGSVSSAVAAMARGSVVIVPTDPMAQVSKSPCDGVGPVWRVVAAVDTDDQADRVLEQAFAEAEDAAAPLLVVHAVHPDFIAGPYAMVTAMSQEYRDEAREHLDRIMARWTEKFPRVEVTTEVVTGVITDVLRERLSRHDVVVVGGRKHSALVGRVLGSVPDKLVRHATCPVMIAHEPR
ncbi:universal stress protein [Isoptericola chiayiensis]|uniref:Universal stress protein n=1 Tax=Isoptericola chiayiensis TaxID=579446 RepID=A0ABP8YQ02_9MICO|nr:universal stress protein [Isoptericola chiayiensis]NOW01369.1 nucleotide-binding universal stress UspA family protein [Isoptericola chiayiensis]